MRKYLTSLLILASSLLLPDEIFADEQVRRVQEELRKRHLFYADANGEKSAALSLALKRYQEKKGFSATGAIDAVTLASLGLPIATPFAATTPVVVGKRGQVNGANGERLPNDPPVLWRSEERVSKFDPAVIDRDYIDLALAAFDREEPQRRRTSARRIRLTGPQFERGTASEAAFDSTSEGIRHVTANPVWGTLGLQPAAELSGEFAIDGGRAGQVAVRPDRQSPRRTRRVRVRKETNPLVLTFQSVDRAIRSLFGDTQTKKKRSISKRL
jgi:peptidoglycan hydrolase-like protein with peptidoglycan-binding domain